MDASRSVAGAAGEIEISTKKGNSSTVFGVFLVERLCEDFSHPLPYPYSAIIALPRDDERERSRYSRNGRQC